MVNMDVAIVSMGRTLGKFSRLEHCCYELIEELIFPTEIFLFCSALKEQGVKTCFFDGNLTEEKIILKKLMRTKPERIIYYIYTPYIRYKTTFIRKLSKISKTYLAIVPFFWKEKILKEFPFVEDVFYDGEKGMGIDTKDTRIDYDKIDLSPYQKEYFPLLVQKYCPYKCSFCNARETGLMERNLEIICEEVEYLKSRGIKNMRLCGNNLTIRNDWFFELCDIMREFGVKWSGDGRVNHMNEEMCKALKESNGWLLFGVESADQEILDKMNKGLRIEQIIENTKMHKKMNVPFKYSFMFGFPQDSYRTFNKMIELRKKVGPSNYACSFPMAYPGFPLFEQMEELGLVKEEELDFEDFSFARMPLAPTLYLSKDELKWLAGKVLKAGAFSKNTIERLLKERKLTEYPRLGLKAIKLLITGRQVWIK